MDRSLSEEILLRILSFLDPQELCTLQQVNLNFHRLASDPQLWKRLFYTTFVRPSIDSATSKGSHQQLASSARPLPTLSGLRSLLLHQNLTFGKLVRGDGNRIARLPDSFYRQRPESIPQEAEAELAALFGSHRPDHEPEQPTFLDWQQVYRVSSNWQRGQFKVSELQRRSATLDEPREAQKIIARASANLVFASRSFSNSDTPIVDIFATTQSRSAGARRFKPDDPMQRAAVSQLRSTKLHSVLQQQNNVKPCSITEIAIDAAVDVPAHTRPSSTKRRRPDSRSLSSESNLRVLVTYSTGHFSIFVISQPSPDNVRVDQEYLHSPAPGERIRDVALSAFHSHLVVLCSASLDISIYQLCPSDSNSTQFTVRLVQQLSSYRSTWPASIRLKSIPFYDGGQKRFRPDPSSQAHPKGRQDDVQASSVPEEVAYRLTIAYSTPAYPNSWTIGIQEIVIRLPLDPSKTASIKSRCATARHQFRSTPIDPRGPSLFSLTSLLGRRRTHLPWLGESSSTASNRAREPNHNRITSLTYDDPFIVLGARDNVVEVYELFGATTHVRLDDETDSGIRRSATATPTSSGESLRVVHRRVLHGHTGSVQSVALEDGRCVTGSADGSVMVWSLGERVSEADSIASVLRRYRRSGRSSSRNGRATSHSRRSAGTEASSNSNDLDLNEAGEAVDMTHVLTLRAPTGLWNETIEEEAEYEEEESLADDGTEETRIVGSSMADLVRRRNAHTHKDQTAGVITWVSTAFDKIVTIVTYPSASAASAAEPARISEAANQKVQIWNFA